MPGVRGSAAPVSSLVKGGTVWRGTRIPRPSRGHILRQGDPIRETHKTGLYRMAAQDVLEKHVEELESVVIRLAGDSGDGMQLTGGQFTRTAALIGNDISTL